MAKIDIGTCVHLHATSLESVGLTRSIRGGEGVVIAMGEDTKGPFYTVKMHRNGKTRTVREDHLTIHRNQEIRHKDRRGRI